MQSAIAFHPTKTYQNQLLVGCIGLLADWCRDLAEVSGEPVTLLMQHDLKKDLLTASVELPKKTLSFTGKHPRHVLSNLTTQVFKEYGKSLRNNAPRKTKKRSTRTRTR